MLQCMGEGEANGGGDGMAVAVARGLWDQRGSDRAGGSAVYSAQ
jgi:hypothetical protein